VIRYKRSIGDLGQAIHHRRSTTCDPVQAIYDRQSSHLGYRGTSSHRIPPHTCFTPQCIHHATLSSTIPFYSQFGYHGTGGTEAGLNLRSHVAKLCDQLELGTEKSMFSAVYSGGNAKLASGAQAEHQDKGDVLRIRSGQ
jgi:hypothetical protein